MSLSRLAPALAQGSDVSLSQESNAGRFFRTQIPAALGLAAALAASACNGGEEPVGAYGIQEPPTLNVTATEGGSGSETDDGAETPAASESFDGSDSFGDSFGTSLPDGTGTGEMPAETETENESTDTGTDTGEQGGASPYVECAQNGPKAPCGPEDNGECLFETIPGGFEFGAVCAVECFAEGKECPPSPDSDYNVRCTDPDDDGMDFRCVISCNPKAENDCPMDMVCGTRDYCIYPPAS